MPMGVFFCHFLFSTFTDILTFHISQVVGARHPLAMDPELDYEVDSDEEWEEVFSDYCLFKNICES